MSITLPVAADLYNVFGRVNINSWADADNLTEEDSIDARIEWAIEQAANYITAKLARKYKVEDWTTFPAIVKDLVVRRAGVELYRTPRGMTDGSDMSQTIGMFDQDIENRLNLILAGALILIDLVEDQPANVPGVYNALSPFQRREIPIQVRADLGLTPSVGVTTDDLVWVET